MSAELTTEEITELNQRVDGDKADPDVVAREYVEGKGRAHRGVATRGAGALELSEAQDKNALVVTQETAQEHGLETVSDLAEVGG